MKQKYLDPQAPAFKQHAPVEVVFDDFSPGFPDVYRIFHGVSLWQGYVGGVNVSHMEWETEEEAQKFLDNLAKSKGWPKDE